MKSLLILFLLAACLRADIPQWEVIETKPWVDNGKKLGTHYKIKNISKGVIEVGHGVNGEAVSNWFMVTLTKDGKEHFVGLSGLLCHEIPRNFIGIQPGGVVDTSLPGLWGNNGTVRLGVYCKGKRMLVKPIVHKSATK